MDASGHLASGRLADVELDAMTRTPSELDVDIAKALGPPAGVTVHGVLAGAYRGADVSKRALLTHASKDGGETALCGKVKKWSLCDQEEDWPPTCATCARRVAGM